MVDRMGKRKHVEVIISHQWFAFVVVVVVVVDWRMGKKAETR